MGRKEAAYRLLAVAVALCGIAIAGLAANTLIRYAGWSVKRMDPAALSAMLAPHYRIVKPAGDGPFPTALLFSGCDGVKDNMGRWAERLAAEGWAALIVDSHSPRGYDDYEVWRLICAGQLMMGSERAGDVAVAISDALSMPFVDPERIALVGMSHGGWAIMDLLALDPPANLPFNLSKLPDGFAGTGTISAAVLVYPWCGPANRAANNGGWEPKVPVFFILARGDLIAPSRECLAVVESLEQRGLPVETLIFEDVTHGFDQIDRSAPTWLRFDPAATEAALARAVSFLDGATSRVPD